MAGISGTEVRCAAETDIRQTVAELYSAVMAEYLALSSVALGEPMAKAGPAISESASAPIRVRFIRLLLEAKRPRLGGKE
jgi:hypothetical protein